MSDVTRRTRIPCRLGAAITLSLAIAAFGSSFPTAAAEPIKIGTLKLAAGGLVFIAVEKGYFAAEGLNPELVFFDASQPIALATASGDVDFGVTGLTGGFYSLAGQGALRLIAGSAHEVPGFRVMTFAAANSAYTAGVKTYRDLPGHSVAISQIGSPPHYTLALIAEKYRFDLASLRLMPLQSMTNQVAAVSGGQVDVVVTPVTAIMPAIERGDAKLIGFSGDEVPWQSGGAFTATKTANEKPDMVERFLRALRHGARDYHDAFTGLDGKRKDGAAAPEIEAIISKYTGEPVERIKLGIAYIDEEARLDVKDVFHQIAWYKSQGMVKGEIDGDQVVDKRYVVPLPGE
jgi:NitT/TauT family transport system substrate-binding protein